MGVLEQVTEMKNQGMPESEIISNLQQQRISQKEINDALSQSQIKSAILGPNEETQAPTTNQPPIPEPEDSYAPEAPEYTPQQAPMPPLQEPMASPQTQEDFSQEPMASPQTQEDFSQEPSPYSQSQEYPQDEYYPQESYAAGGGTETDTIIEIAEQVASEKVKDLEKKIDKLNEFSTLAGTKLANLTERIKKIEAIIDKLQLSILDKVGSYGQNLDSIKKEMSMMQDSFKKTTKKKTRKKK